MRTAYVIYNSVGPGTSELVMDLTVWIHDSAAGIVGFSVQGAALPSPWSAATFDGAITSAVVAAAAELETGTVDVIVRPTLGVV